MLMLVAFDKLLEYQECWRSIRERTLDDWAKARDQELQMQRNSVQGGLIQADMFYVRQVRNVKNGRWNSWMRTESRLMKWRRNIYPPI
jgi:hypothetical protein